MDKDRKVLGVFISGTTGTGKTTWVKDYCTKIGKSLCVSSSSNDPLQDYKGEDVLLLDDLKDKVFDFHDLLKILDRHTKSTSKSRYHNKFFMGDTIFITSTIPLESWYFNIKPEEKQQLKRRLQQQYQFTTKKIDVFLYDELARKYNFVKSLHNTIASLLPIDSRDFISDEMGMFENNSKPKLF